MAWYVLRCNIKSEDKAERNLAAAGFRTYAPWQKFERFSTRKKVWLQWEMRVAPRYVFIETPDHDVPWRTITKCEGVEHPLGVDEGHGRGGAYSMRPIPLNIHQTEQLMAIMQAEKDFAFDETRAGKLHRREIGKTKKETTRMKFPVGSKVRVNDGLFLGFPGEVTNVTGRGHLTVLLKLFGSMTPVELEVGQVEGIASAA